MTAITVCWLALYAAVLGWLRGTGEGMVFVKPRDAQHTSEWACHSDMTNQRIIHIDRGYFRQFDLGPRGHVWHRYYHAIDGIKDAMFIGLGVWLVLVWSGTVKDYLTVALAGAVIWLTYEPAYSYARYRRFDNNGEPEHCNFFDLVIKVPWYGPHKMYHVQGNESAYVMGIGWYMRQILPFHAPVLTMTLVRLAIVCVTITISL